MKNKIVEFQDWLEYKIRLLCGKIAIEYRFPTILIILVLFGSTSIYMFVSSIYYIGKHDGEEKIRQVEELENKKDSVLLLRGNILDLPDSW